LSEHEGLLTPLIAREQRRLKASSAISRNPQFDRAHSRRELPAPVPVAHVAPRRRSFEGLRPNQLRKLARNLLLHQRLQYRPQRIGRRPAGFRLPLRKDPNR
jgi:hypothetical protein